MRKAISYLLWPGIMIACLLLTQLGIMLGHSILVFNITYVALAATLWKLERVFPHERKWLENDNQMGADLAHTLLSKGVVQVIVVVATITGVVEYVGSSGLKVWPAEWPMALQVVLGLIVMEFGLYWKHRIAHEWLLLWPFHAVHHSSPRLWFFNTGRFHFVDTVSGLMFGLPPLFLLGAPDALFSWMAAITAYIGMLTHCNVEMRFGFLSAVFNTPELHRWHHSRRLRESNANYGENIMLWDQLFGTYFREEARRPPANIGISHKIADGFFAQLKAPFMMRPSHFYVERRGTGWFSRYFVKPRKAAPVPAEAVFTNNLVEEPV